MAKRGTRVEIAHKPWRVSVAKRNFKERWGYIDFNRRVISIAPDAVKTGIDREVLIHEVIHGLFPWLDERVVEEAAECIDDVLTACDY